MSGHIDFRALHTPALYERTPCLIRYAAVLIILQQLRARCGHCLSVLVQLLERCLIYRQGRNAVFLHIPEHLGYGTPLHLCETHNILIVDRKVYGLVAHLYLVALHAYND